MCVEFPTPRRSRTRLPCPPVGKPTQTEQEADGLEDVIDVYDPDFTAELLQRGYGVTGIEGDGNCLFRAVSQSLFGTE